MKMIPQWPALLLWILLHCSCAQTPVQKQESQEPKSVAAVYSDSLVFTSGIRAILQDRKGNYWLGSHQEGVSLFDGKSFRYFTTKEGLADNQIRSIQEDQNGTLWFETASGVSSYDGEKIITHAPQENLGSSNPWSKTTHDLWFGAGNQAGVYRYDGQALSYLAFPPTKLINPNNPYFTTGIAAGKNNMHWIATYAGVFGYNGHRFSILNDESLGLLKQTGTLHIRSIFEDSKGRLWIGNNGIGVLLKEGETTINFSEKHHLIHANSSRRGDNSPAGTLEHVFVIAEDSEGNIWFGDRDTGAWKYDGKRLYNYSIDKQLNTQMVWDIYEDQHQQLLFAMAAGGVYTFNGTSFDKVF